MALLKYCNLCRTQYGENGHICGEWPGEPENISKARQLQAELRNETEIYNEWTKAFWDRIRERV